uniref:SRCR domain-containing protein n=1 Tax=Latimeria chalumnae TaxID=7897 RepID=H2ZYN7_LATCH
IRLVNGGSPCAGRVEVYHSEQWGTVCSDSWDKKDAAVVCKQLGCGAAVEARRGAAFGAGSGVIWLDNVECSKSETALWECSSNGWGNHNCQHSEDAGVICSEVLVPPCYQGEKTRERKHLYWGRKPGAGGRERQTDKQTDVVRAHKVFLGQNSGIKHKEIHLAGGPSPISGRLEVKRHNADWNTVCYSNFDLKAAHAVCRGLGYMASKSFLRIQVADKDVGKILTKTFQCKGEESHLTFCPLSSEDKQCTDKTIVSITCCEPSAPISAKSLHWVLTNCVLSSGYKGYRLVNGSDVCSGRVEIQNSDTWGTLCDHQWDLQDADVLCRQLHCGYAVNATTEAYFGEGQGHSGKIWLDDLSCSGNESTLWQCPSREWGHHDCSPKEDAGVLCSGK